MFFTYDKNDRRVHIDKAVKGQDYFCPCCGASLLQKKGKIRQHHFSHSKGNLCTDTWYYNMTPWHSEWQSQFTDANQEVVLSHENTKHRADVLVGRTVVEFQHSNISPKDFNERNDFYCNLGYKVIWVFDFMEEFKEGYILDLSYGKDPQNTHFGWSRPKIIFDSRSVQIGQVDLFFQLKESETEPCLVKVIDTSKLRDRQFDISRWYSKTEFMEYLGVKNGVCAAPDSNDPFENIEFASFCNKYNILLDKHQALAVQAVEGANLLLAVPGSGKTTVLVDRIGFMIDCKKIDNILTMTHSKAAAKDMRNRFISIFGEQPEKRIEFCTIHSFADSVIKKYTKKFNSTAFEVLSEKEKDSIIRNILKKILGTFPAESDINQVKNDIAYIKNMYPTKLEELAEKKTFFPDINKVYKQYNEELSNLNKMDYYDQLICAFKILQEHSDILDEFHHEFQYICVDEAQDLSKIQHEIIRLLVKNSNNIFMVGDEDQSIYGFRAAHPQALMDFKNYYPNPFILVMEKNYRSTEDIVSKAADFIKDRRISSYNKRFCAARGHGHPVKCIHVETREEQYKYLLEIAKNTMENTAFLYRDNGCAVLLIDLMLQYNVPFRTTKSNEDFFTSRIVNDLLAFIKLALNPRDTTSFKKIYDKCKYHFDKKIIESTCKCVKEENVSIWCAFIKQMRNENSDLFSDANAFKYFITTLIEKKPIDALKAIFDEGYSNYMKRNNLNCGKYEILTILANREQTIKGFLDRLNVLSSYKSPGNSGVTLSTIHSSKGLEYDTVYLMDVYDDVLPTCMPRESTKSKDQYLEECRLLYVGMTRAKDKLFILSIDDKETSFIDEIFSKQKGKANSRHATRAKSSGTNRIPFQPSQKPSQISSKRLNEIKHINIPSNQELHRIHKGKTVEERTENNQEDSKDKQMRLGYEEIKNRFTQQKEPIFDSYGRRWIKCRRCGEIKIEECFTSYGGPGEVNIGTCSKCWKNERDF